MSYNAETANFGVAGFPPSFFKSEYGRKRERIFQWLAEIGLDWIELQNTYGVKMKEEQALLYKKLSDSFRIGISIHGPYYITLASADKNIVQRSKDRILQCYALAEILGAQRIIFHPGHFPGNSANDRKSGLEQIINELISLEHLLSNRGIFLYPETAGKKSQIGSVQDIITICENVSYTKPCIDVAHVHGFESGSLTTRANILNVLTQIEESLGKKALLDTHFHMYPIEIDHTGEKKHRAFHDRINEIQLDLFGDSDNCDRYYPLPEHFIDAIKEKRLKPIVVCEARDSQDSGALLLKKLYYENGDSV